MLLAMPENLLMRYAGEMPRVRALNVLDLAQAAIYPHLTKIAAENWWHRWTRRAAHRIQDALGTFTVNGVPVGVRGLKNKLKELFGRQVETD